jgi:hypothetical protein
LLWEEGQNRTVSLTPGTFTITDENFGQTKIKAKITQSLLKTPQVVQDTINEVKITH